MVDKPGSLLDFPFFLLLPGVRLLGEDSLSGFRIQDLPGYVSEGGQCEQPGDQEHNSQGDNHCVCLVKSSLVKFKVHVHLQHPDKDVYDQNKKKKKQLPFLGYEDGEVGFSSILSGDAGDDGKDCGHEKNEGSKSAE